MNQNYTRKVGEIFSAAGDAFNKLGELTLNQEIPANADSPATYVICGLIGLSVCKWTEKEIGMLRNAVATFHNELNEISERIKRRNAGKTLTESKKKSFDDASIYSPMQSVDSPLTHPQGMIGNSTAEVTLNMLNASESEVDVDTISEGRF